MAATTLEDYNFRKTKKRSPAPKDLPKVDIKPAIKPVPSDDQEFLKAFDLNYDYGPVVGLTRLERWERAKNFGLNPDQRVKDLILQHPTDPKYTQCLWDDTLLGSSSS